MARDPHPPKEAATEAAPADVVLDYELALTTARQFLQHFRGAQHLEHLVLLMTQREHLLLDLERRRVLAETQLQDIEAQVQTARHILAEEEAKAGQVLQVAARREQQTQMRVQELEARIAHLQQVLSDLTARHDETMQDQHVALAAVKATMDAETQRLLHERQQALHEIEAAHLAQLEDMHKQSEAEGQRAERFKAQITTLRQQLTTLDEEG